MQFGAKPLFENVSAKFGDGNRYGLIGANGCGKSTFMKILGGDLVPTSGNVSLDSGARLGKLRQDQFAFEEYPVIDTVMMGDAEFWQIRQERDRIYSLPEMSEADGMRVADLETRFAELDGYTAESRASELLRGVGIPLELEAGLMSEVAPGWKLRVLLAQALFGNPDVLLLDEPTNNLDINSIRWVEDLLNSRDCTMLIISHDRHFLNSVCTHMADLDYGELRIYPGNYDQYMTASTVARERLLADNARKKAQIAELQTFVSRFSAKPSSRVSPFIRFDQARKLYRLALEVEGLTKGYGGEPLFRDLDLKVEVGERIAIIGENGVGKTTLLKCLMQELPPDRGTIKWSENVAKGYVPQDRGDDFAEDLTLFDWIRQWQQKTDDEQALRATLGRMLFSKDESAKSVKVISGGEEGRLLFGKMMLLKPNVLIMDEPTNHLDMESIEALNLALENYPGTLLFVSHDRAFVASLATRVIEMKPDGITDFHGGYEDYLRSQEAGEPRLERRAGR
jgi:ATPase subunit of ABC transporter with duplicated ATPase domains